MFIFLFVTHQKTKAFQDESHLFISNLSNLLHFLRVLHLFSPLTRRFKAFKVTYLRRSCLIDCELFKVIDIDLFTILQIENISYCHPNLYSYI